jgi:hypothetical protein
MSIPDMSTVVPAPTTVAKRIKRNLGWYEKRYQKGYKLLRWGYYDNRGAFYAPGHEPQWRRACWCLRPAMQTQVALRYRVGQWTAPFEGWGPLGVFDTVLNALAFAGKWNGSFCIAECYFDPTPGDCDPRFWYLTVRPPFVFPERDEPAADIWERRYAKCETPAGTRYADRLILTRLLPTQELYAIEGMVGDRFVQEGKAKRWGRVLSSYQQYGLPLDWHDPSSEWLKSL